MSTANTIQRWIDLSRLPMHMVPGKRYCVDWKNTAGMSVPFKYGDDTGEIKILQYDENRMLHIYIDGITSNEGYKIHTYNFAKCMLGEALRRCAAVTNPEIIKYFVNEEDAYKYSAQSGHVVEAKCPLCGYIKHYSIATLTNYTFSCNRCGDNVSYPNKFMFHLLKQIGIDFIPEISRRHKGFQWLNNYRCDFYFIHNKKQYFIEMDGAFHHRNLFMSAEHVQKNDRLKDELAHEHNINVIRINCNYDDRNKFAFICKSIQQSNLLNIFNLCADDVDWVSCHEHGLSNLVVQACEYWNNGIENTTKIAKIIGVTRGTVLKYLKTGAELGWCTYSVDRAIKVREEDTFKKWDEIRLKPIIVYRDNIFVGAFRCADDLSEQSIDIYDTYKNASQIRYMCKKKEQCGGSFLTQYITLNEYYQYINNGGDMCEAS